MYEKLSQTAFDSWKTSYLPHSTLTSIQGRKGVFGPYLHMLICLSGIIKNSVKQV